MSGSVLAERVISTVPAPVNWVEANISPNGFAAGANYTALKSPCLVDDIVYDKGNFSEVPQAPDRVFTGINIDGTNYTVPDECLYKLEWLYGAAINAFQSETLFSGTCTYDSRQGGALWCQNAWWLSPLYSKQNASFATINSQISQYATAVTNKFRAIGSSNNNVTLQESALGAVIEMTVCTSFDWRWLLMPLMLLAATTTVLTVMMIQNYKDPRQPVWKSSVLPLLFHGFDSSSRANSKPAMDLDQMSKEAHYVNARFQNGMDTGFVHATNVGARNDRDDDVDMDSLIRERRA